MFRESVVGWGDGKGRVELQKTKNVQKKDKTQEGHRGAREDSSIRDLDNTSKAGKSKIPSFKR